MAYNEYLVNMDYSWFYIERDLFGSANFSQETKAHLDFVKHPPTRIRYILCFYEDKAKELVGYSEQDIQSVFDYITDNPLIQLTTIAVQFDLVRASQNDVMLKRKPVPDAQYLILKAPLDLPANTTAINFNRVSRICRHLGVRRILFDTSGDMLQRMLSEIENDDTANVSWGTASRRNYVFYLHLIMSYAAIYGLLIF